jgi:hypothetical protein
MSAQRSAPEASDAQPECVTFASLPHSLQCEVFARTPVDARARAAAVCKAWCGVLAERSLWTQLDLSPASGVARKRITDALLRGAAAKAHGDLTALDVSDCEQLSHKALLKVVTANAGALTELRTCQWASAVQVVALLRAAPLLRVCHADVSQAAPAVARRMLRNEPPFGPLRMHELPVFPPWRGGEADVHKLAADLAGSASSLSRLCLVQAPLAGSGAMDAVVDAALARRLPCLSLADSSLSAACVPALARLLRGSALNSLSLSLDPGAEPLLLSGAEGSAALLAAALRANNTLTELLLFRANVWHDAAAAETVLHALTAHPSVRCLRLLSSTVRAFDRARAGISLGALVAANAPALEVLDIRACCLGDEGLSPLVNALRRNTHLRELECSGNDLSDAFVLHQLMPALLANGSLRMLTLIRQGDIVTPGLRRLEQLVTERAAARDAAAAAAVQ